MASDPVTHVVVYKRGPSKEIIVQAEVAVRIPVEPEKKCGYYINGGYRDVHTDADAFALATQVAREFEQVQAVASG